MSCCWFHLIYLKTSKSTKNEPSTSAWFHIQNQNSLFEWAKMSSRPDAGHIWFISKFPSDSSDIPPSFHPIYLSYLQASIWYIWFTSKWQILQPLTNAWVLFIPISFLKSRKMKPEESSDWERGDRALRDNLHCWSLPSSICLTLQCSAVHCS